MYQLKCCCGIMSWIPVRMKLQSKPFVRLHDDIEGSYLRDFKDCVIVVRDRRRSHGMMETEARRLTLE